MSVSPKPVEKAEDKARLAIFDTEQRHHLLSRRDVSCTDGRRYRLFQALPREPGTGQVPALFMLDGNAAFDALTPELLDTVPGLAIFGVGYPTDDRFDRAARALDYTPPRNSTDPSPDPKRPGRMLGGGAQFVTRLVDELVPAAENALPGTVSHRTLWGHSLAGMLVLYTLLSKPGHFVRYAAASPSLWWSDELLLTIEAETDASACGEADVRIMLGDSERRSSPEGPHWDGPAPHTLEMIARLQRRRGLCVESDVFSGLGHAATLPASLQATLRMASADAICGENVSATSGTTFS